MSAWWRSLQWADRWLLGSVAYLLGCLAVLLIIIGVMELIW